MRQKPPPDLGATPVVRLCGLSWVLFPPEFTWRSNYKARYWWRGGTVARWRGGAVARWLAKKGARNGGMHGGADDRKDKQNSKQKAESGRTR